MIKKLIFLLPFLVSLAFAGGPISRPSNVITGPGSSKVQINLDGSIDIVTASGTPLKAYGSTNRFDIGPLELGSISAPAVSGAGDVRLYWDGAHIYKSANGGAYAIFGEGGGLASTDIDTSAELAAILGDETGTGVFVLNASPTFTGTVTAPLLTLSGASAASAPAELLTGAWFTGGTGTTTFPHFLLQAAGTTASTTWSTAGTAIGLNAVTGFTGNFVDYKLAGVTKAKIDIGGTNISNAGFFMVAGPPVGFNQFGFDLGLNHPIYWSSSDSTGNNRDVAIVRNAAGVLEIDSSVAGTYRDLILRNITVGGSSGTQVKLIRSATATLDFTSTAAQTSAELSITLTGAVDGDDVIVSPPNGSNNANTCFTARVSAADTVQVKFNNFSSGAVDPASGTFRVSLVQF